MHRCHRSRRSQASHPKRSTAEFHSESLVLVQNACSMQPFLQLPQPRHRHWSICRALAGHIATLPRPSRAGFDNKLKGASFLMSLLTLNWLRMTPSCMSARSRLLPAPVWTTNSCSTHLQPPHAEVLPLRNHVGEIERRAVHASTDGSDSRQTPALSIPSRREPKYECPVMNSTDEWRTRLSK